MSSALVVVSGYVFFFSSRRRHTRLQGDWSSDVCSSDLSGSNGVPPPAVTKDKRAAWSVNPGSPGRCGDWALRSASWRNSRRARPPCNPLRSAPSRARASKLTCAAAYANNATMLVSTMATRTSSRVNPETRLTPRKVPSRQRCLSSHVGGPRPIADEAHHRAGSAELAGTLPEEGSPARSLGPPLHLQIPRRSQPVRIRPLHVGPRRAALRGGRGRGHHELEISTASHGVRISQVSGSSATALAVEALRTSNAQLPSGDTMSVTGAARNGSRRPAASVPSSGFAPPSRRHWPVRSIVRWGTSPRRAAASRALATRSLRVAACWCGASSAGATSAAASPIRISTTSISTSVNPGRARVGRAIHPSCPPIKATSKTRGGLAPAAPLVTFTPKPLQVPWQHTVRATPDRADLARQPLGIERQRAQELRCTARLPHMLEPRGELNQGRLAEGRAHEADAYGHTEHEAHRHVDDGVAHDRRR